MPRVGLISDTHGLLRPAAVEALRGSDFLVHAGDIGPASILEALAALAPLTVVRGNCDTEAWTRKLPETALLRVEEVSIYVLHDLGQLDLEPAAEGIRVVVYGHSHHPSIEERGGVLYVNPGSAGPRRFRLPVTLALLEVDGATVEARVVELEPGDSTAGLRPVRR